MPTQGSKRPVVVVGFSGSGKTTVGDALRESFGCTWVDLDQYVETQIGQTITSLIRVEGEKRFRELETEALRKAIADSYDVISTGGGILLSKDNADFIAAQSTCVALVVSKEKLVSRIVEEERTARAQGKEAIRPLVADAEANEAMIAERVAALYEKRAGLYEQAAVQLYSEQASAAVLALAIMSIREVSRKRLGVLPFQTAEQTIIVMIGEGDVQESFDTPHGKESSSAVTIRYEHAASLSMLDESEFESRLNALFADAGSEAPAMVAWTKSYLTQSKK